MTDAEALARLKPKIEPTPDLLEPLYDQLVQAKHLIDCAYLATRAMTDDIGEPIRAALDEGIRKLSSIEAALHDMVAWVDLNAPLAGNARKAMS